MTTSNAPEVGMNRQQQEALAREYMPLVKRIAAGLSKKAPASVTIDDLVSAGMYGLVDAASRYDPTRAEKFQSYAEARVRGAMIDELRSVGPLSRDLRLKSHNLTKTIQKLELELGRQPFQSEIADELGLDIGNYHKLLVQLRHTTVLSPDIVNQAIDKSEVGDDAAEFILNRVKMQDRYRGEVNESFENVRAEIPLFEREVRGTEMVARLSEAIFPNT